MWILKNANSKNKCNFFEVSWKRGLIENTLELLFINNPIEFSNTLFFIHSIIASLKWMALPIIVTFIIKLSLQDNANVNKSVEITKDLTPK